MLLKDLSSILLQVQVYSLLILVVRALIFGHPKITFSDSAIC